MADATSLMQPSPVFNTEFIEGVRAEDQMQGFALIWSKVKLRLDDLAFCKQLIIMNFFFKNCTLINGKQF